MSKTIIILLLSITTILSAKNRLLYELKESSSQIYGKKILFPYFYDIETKDKKIDNLNEIFKFLVLRNDKIYGNSYLVVTPETEKKMLSEKIITIQLKDYKKEFFNDILSEVIYTFTSNGIKGVIFLNNPIDNKNSLFTRDNVKHTTFTLLIDMWRVLPPNKIEYILIKLPNNQVIKAKKFYKKLLNNDKTIIKFVLNYIKNGTKYEQINAMRSLSYIKKFKKRDKYLLPLLKDKDRDIVLAALDGLIGFKNPKVLLNIETLLKNSKNNSIKLNSAKILIASGKKKFVISGLKYFLNCNKIDEKLTIIKSIANHKDSEEMLLLMLDDKNEKIKLEVLENLKIAKKDKTFNKLKVLLNDKSEKVKIIVSNILTTNKKYKRFGLYYQLKLNDEKTAIMASKSLESFKDKETIKNLLECLKHKNVNIAYSCANSLLVDKEKSSIVPFFHLANKNLSKLPKGMDMKFINLLKADELLSLLVKEKIELLQKDIIKRFSEIYKDKKDIKIVKVISNFLDSKNEDVRVQTVKTLNLIGGKEALNNIIQKRKDSSIKVRFEMLNMFNRYSKNEIKDSLIDYLNDTNDQLRIKTMDLLIKFKIKKSIPQLKQYTTSSIREIKLKALEALVTISDKIDEDMEGKFQTLLDQDDSKIRLWAIYGLVKTYKKTNLPFIVIYAKDSLPEVRKAVIYATGELNNSSNPQTDLAYGALDDDSDIVKYEAALTLAKIGSLEDVNKINKLLSKYNDSKLKKLLNSAIKKIKDRNSLN